MSQQQIIQINSIIELFNIINSGSTVVLYRDAFTSKKLYKVWQLEKKDENEYSFRLYRGYTNAPREIFYVDAKTTNKEIRFYFDAIRRALSNIVEYIDCKPEDIEKIFSQEIIDYSDWLFYSIIRNNQRRKEKQKTFSQNFIFKVYKTRKISKQLGCKDGENLIRQALNKFIEKRHKNGIRHDEYRTSGRNFNKRGAK